MTNYCSNIGDCESHQSCDNDVVISIYDPSIRKDTPDLYDDKNQHDSTKTKKQSPLLSVEFIQDCTPFLHEETDHNDCENDITHCIVCGIDMKEPNQRQLCCKTYCHSEVKHKKPRLDSTL